jgi:hypothetical protein
MDRNTCAFELFMCSQHLARFSALSELRQGRHDSGQNRWVIDSKCGHLPILHLNLQVDLAQCRSPARVQ